MLRVTEQNKHVTGNTNTYELSLQNPQNENNCRQHVSPIRQLKTNYLLMKRRSDKDHLPASLSFFINLLG